MSSAKASFPERVRRFRLRIAIPSVALAAFAATVASSAPREYPRRISRGDLVGLLDPGYPGMGEILRLRASNGDAAALRALALHLRTRRQVDWTDGDSSVCVPDPEIDSALVGTHRSIGLWYHHGPEIDWFHDPTGTDGRPRNVEWILQFHRHHWWPGLGCRWQRTGDARYARVFAQELSSWIAQCPPPAEVANRPGSAWRTIEAGIRMLEAWPDALQRFRTARDIPDTLLLDAVASMLEHGAYLEAHPTGRNWLFMEMDGLHAVGSYLPEFKPAARWRSTALHATDSALAAQLLPDGVQEELSPSYHALVLACARHVTLRARRSGLGDTVPPRIAQVLEAGYDALAGIIAPDRDYPRVNDAHDIDIPRILSQALESFPGRDDWRWIATSGSTGTPPPLARLYPWAGWAVFRTSHGRDANMLMMDRGATGAGHQHQDKLSLCGWAHGRRILFDDGGGPYEDSPYRAYALSTASHSTILVDGHGQNRDPARPNRADSSDWHSDSASGWVRGRYDEGWGPRRARTAAHIRTVIFQPEAWIVHDSLVPTDDAQHSYENRWQILSTRVVCDRLACRSEDPGRANLAIIPLPPALPSSRLLVASPPPDVGGWNATLAGRLPATTLVQLRNARGPAGWTTLLVPLPPGDTSRVVSVESGPAGIRIGLTDRSAWRLTGAPSGPGASRPTLRVERAPLR